MKLYKNIMMVVAARFMLTGSVWAGDMNPPGAPGPTMYTLEEIYQKVANLEARLNSAGTHVTSGDMVLIPAGNFVMGLNTNVGHTLVYTSEVPQHTVYVSAFYMDRYEVTSNLWRDVYAWATSTNKGYVFGAAGYAKDGLHPVVSNDWYDIIAWCNARSERDGFKPCYTNADGSIYTNSVANSFSGGCDWSANGYRLPTEAEWEKAARGGVPDRQFPWSDANTIQHTRANYKASPGNTNVSYDTSATTGNHPYSTEPKPYTLIVGSLPANGYGLYDMAGNVYERCWDYFSETYYTVSPTKDPRGPDSGYFGSRVMRGGAWNDNAVGARVAFRAYALPWEAGNQVGFRTVRGL